MRLAPELKAFNPLLWAVVLLSSVAQAVDPPGDARRPPPVPDPRARAIPEIVCTGERAVTVANDGLETRNEESPLRLRLRGNLLYVGQTRADEQFFGLINRSDRRRWTSGTTTLVLDEGLERGVWVRLALDTTRISTIRCAPFSAAP
jgi:hypothetical protein